MTGAPHYSLTDVARELGVPLTTLRYYRDSYSAYLPVVGHGRRRLYPAPALSRLALITAGYAEGKPRQEIESELAAMPQDVPATASTAVTKYDDVLVAVLDGESERRHAMRDMAREMVRLGETIERLHTIVEAVAKHVGASERALSAPSPGEEDRIPLADASPIDAAVARELEELRSLLEAERQLVERLRRSKVEIERRAADAEAQLEHHGARARGAGGSILSRLLAKGSTDG